ncbi:RTC4-like domain-containing protein [Kalaharituber pfeilii]|nr:RTC4-like domain-containing protein [Kalaharituber pfeilii]
MNREKSPTLSTASRTSGSSTGLGGKSEEQTETGKVHSGKKRKMDSKEANNDAVSTRPRRAVAKPAFVNLDTDDGSAQAASDEEKETQAKANTKPATKIKPALDRLTRKTALEITPIEGEKVDGEEVQFTFATRDNERKKDSGKENDSSATSNKGSSHVLDDLDLEKDETDTWWENRETSQRQRRRTQFTYGRAGRKAHSIYSEKRTEVQKTTEKPKPAAQAPIATWVEPMEVQEEESSSTRDARKNSSPQFINPYIKYNVPISSPDELQNPTWDLENKFKSEQKGNSPGDSRSPSKKRKSSTYITDSDGSPLTSPTSSPIAAASSLEPVLPSPRDGPNYCTICEQYIDPEFLAKYPSLVKKIYGIQKKMDRCERHKRFSAEKECRSKGYPAMNINWRGIHKRVNKYLPFLEEILAGKRKSAYRDELKEDQKRTKKLYSMDWESHTPGYYGPRGASIMVTAVMRNLAERIHEAAATDRVISTGGVMAYVQAVLVPELSVQFIKEDMKVDEEKARKIVKETMEIGELINGDDDDPNDDDDEDDGGVWIRV